MKLTKVALLAWFVTVVFLASSFAAEQAKVITLPQPRTTGGKPLMWVLKERRTSREFSPKELSAQTLANLLWAGFGVNRPDGKRTAPSARNMQEVDIYVAKLDGLYRYNAQHNVLELVLSGDIREATGKQDFVKVAPVNLIYVVDLSKMKDGMAQQDSYAALDTGFIAENVCLFCASEGLATVVRGSFDPEKLNKAMGLGPDQKIILTQTIGYPK